MSVSSSLYNEWGLSEDSTGTSYDTDDTDHGGEGGPRRRDGSCSTVSRVGSSTSASSIVVISFDRPCSLSSDAGIFSLPRRGSTASS